MMFLTQDEVATLTGKARKSKQKQVLEAQGIRYIENALGEIIISRAHVEHLLGGQATPEPRTNAPNFDKLLKVS